MKPRTPRQWRVWKAMKPQPAGKQKGKVVDPYAGFRVGRDLAAFHHWHM